ncbi:MAG: hypothetical protein V4572_04175 [Bacteroidota bacterium]
MKKYLLVLCFILTNSIYSQRYYPGLYHIFLTADSDEKLFSSDLLYIKKFLQVSTERMFYADLQANVSPDNTSAFYSLGLIPKGNKSNPFMDTGINLVFDPKGTTKDPKILITLEQVIKKEDNNKSLYGHLYAYSEGLILEFPATMVVSFQAKPKKTSQEEKKSQFLIKKIDFELSENLFKATIEGKFDGLIKFTTNKKVPKIIKPIILELTKDLVTIKFSFIDKKGKEQIFSIVHKLK